MEKIIEFTGKYSFLSNFYEVFIRYDGLKFDSVEAAYQAQKFHFPLKLRFITPCTAKEAKALSNRHRLNVRANFHEEKLGIMQALVRLKFSNNSFLNNLLRNTGDAVLEEGNWWGDKYWGISPKGSGVGSNHLGKILMELRKELKEKQDLIDGYKDIFN